jgi:hypothetical protein
MEFIIGVNTTYILDMTQDMVRSALPPLVALAAIATAVYLDLLMRISQK